MKTTKIKAYCLVSGEFVGDQEGFGYPNSPLALMETSKKKGLLKYYDLKQGTQKQLQTADRQGD